MVFLMKPLLPFSAPNPHQHFTPMTTAITKQEAEAINKKGYQLGHQAGNLQQGAEALLECAKINPKLTDNKRKSYFREARKELKLAANLFTQGAGFLQQTLDVHPIYSLMNRITVSKWLARADHCLVLVKNSKHS
jgi:hypothetical protein